MKFFGRKRKKEKSTVQVSKIKTHYRIGLSLSGGGARGVAHIGALKAFEEEGFEFAAVAGTSAGSIVGALYCAGHTATEMKEMAMTINDRDIRNSTFILTPSRSSNIERMADRWLEGATFEEMKIPFFAVAVDLVTGEEVVLHSGNVAKAVSASSAVPIIFTPVIDGDRVLVDGGLLNTIPSDVLRLNGCDFVIAVDLNSGRGEGTSSRKMWDMAQATWRIVMKSTAFKGTMNSDVMIEPDLSKFKSTTLLGREEMIEIGYQATMAKMKEIKQNLGIKL